MICPSHTHTQSVEGDVQPESGDNIPIKMLDCDSITQAKEKVLDALYKNCPASKRPQLTEVDLSKCVNCVVLGLFFLSRDRRAK